MLPTPSMTLLHVVDLDVGRHLDINGGIPIGAAILTVELRGSAVDVALDSCILRPSDTTEPLFTFLARHIVREGATIIGYGLRDAIASLASLPGGDEAPALRAMGSCHRQYLLDLSATSAGGPVSFRQACEHAGVTCSHAEPAQTLHAWVRCDVAKIEELAQADVIALFWLLLRRLASINQVGRSIADALGNHLRVWLDQSDHPAAKAHIADLLSADD